MTITNEDCMAMMARYPDGYFDLAIVDPPYGIGIDNGGLGLGKGKKHKYKMKSGWDKNTPTKIYFDMLLRISGSQIIWGGQYMCDKLPVRGGWICWDKGVAEGLSFSDFELAWTSFNQAAKKVRIDYSGNSGRAILDQLRIHPTQKPVALYKWLLDKYAAPIQAKLDRPMRILDTHLGSGSIAIACHDYGYDLTACELDPDYYAAAMKRIRNHMAQQRLF